jgi:hypothetical protein
LLVAAGSPAADDTAPDRDVHLDGGSAGYRVGDSGLWLGGYATVNVEVPRSSPASADIGDLGILVRYELTPRLSFFNETDLEDTVSLVEGSGVESGSQVLLLERLYVDWLATGDLTVRVGKFLTPFGIWNVIRRAPLTWTVDRPVATQEAFPDHITGLSLMYQTTRRGWSFDALAYGQPQDELVVGASDISATGAGGGRVVAAHTIGRAYATLGASTIAFENRDTGRWEDSYGADLDLTLPGNHVIGEFAYTRHPEPGTPHEWSLYVQDVVPIYRTLYGVFRFEHIDPADHRSVNGPLIGLAWRALPHVILKADYQFVDHEGTPEQRSALERGFFAGVTFFY